MICDFSELLGAMCYT